MVYYVIKYVNAEKVLKCSEYDMTVLYISFCAPHKFPKDKFIIPLHY